ncbi:hypothetical protein MMC34_002650 [Xylographa carneopallida]|nr:hypothetical protein [Xylographa carneopallida]
MPGCQYRLQLDPGSCAGTHVIWLARIWGSGVHSEPLFTSLHTYLYIPIATDLYIDLFMTRFIQPGQSRKPFATPLAMSTIPPGATASPIPLRPAKVAAESTITSRPHPKPGIPTPKLRFECKDLTHPGALVFFSTTNPATILSDAVTVVLQTLYIPFEGNAAIPPTRSITLILRSMPGVAYTTGIDLDDDHKEIHFSLDYIAGIKNTSASPQRQRQEIEGVIVHEMVHCWQWNALGTAPSGLIEGIADFVRLRDALGPPHWKKEGGGDWDAGYQHTAYFLEWMDARFGEGNVMRVNEALRDKKYNEKHFWTRLFGKSVQDLWSEYSRTFDADDSEEGVLVENDTDDDGKRRVKSKSETQKRALERAPSGFV